MIKYLLNTETGKLCVKKEEGLAGEKDKSQEIFLMKLEEFNVLEGSYPYRKNLNRSMNPVHYCKIEMFRECIQGTIKMPKGNDEKAVLSTFGFYMKGEQLFLIEQSAVLKTIIEKIKNNIYGKCTLKQFLLVLFEVLIEDDVLYLQHLEGALEELEMGLLETIPKHFYEIVIEYRKKLSLLHSYYEQLMNIGDMMQTNINRELTIEECGAWQHYTDRTERLHNHTERLMEHLIQIRELYQSQIDIQQNKVMSFLTIVTTIFLPLTLIAGWYGMNFPNMPEFGWKYGYVAVIIISIAIIIAEILYFKRKKML